MHVRRHLNRAALLLAAVSLPVFAQTDTTLRPTTMRAGPDAAFPAVTRLPTSSNLHVFGCVEARTWCDVLSGRTRGWVNVTDLRPTGRLRDAPVVAFSVADYWDAHYRRRPWYANRDRWLGWGTPGFQPPGGTAK